MAQSPAATTKIPMTPPPDAPEGSSRVTVASRSGWKFPDGSILFDDGEKVVPPSGLSDADKRLEALRAALGELPAATEPGALLEEIDSLRSAAAALEDPAPRDDKRRKAAKQLAERDPASEPVEARRLYAELPPSAAEGQAALRVQARQLASREYGRVEELKALASHDGVFLLYDGVPFAGNGPARLHDRLIEALNAAERGDLKAVVDALAELKRWSLPAQEE